MGLSGIGNYSTTPANNTSAPPAGAPEGMAANQYNNTLREIMANLALLLRDFPWLDIFIQYTVSKLTDSTCRIAGVDVTTQTPVGRRIKIAGASTVQGYILATAFTGGNTDLTVAVDDGGVVPASITKIEVGVDTLLSQPDIPQIHDLCANPEADVWRLGTSITSSTPYTADSGNYTADQIIVMSDTDNVVALSQLTSLPTDARSGMRMTVVTANKKFAFGEPFTNKDTINLRSKPVSFQIRLRNTGGTLGAVRLGLLVWTGTANAFTKEAFSAWGAAGTNPTPATNWAFITTPVASTPTLSTSFQTFKLENQLIPSNAVNFAWVVFTDDVTVSAGEILDWTQCQIDVGPRCLPFRQRPLPEIERRCRFFRRSTFRRNVAPANNLNNFADCLVVNTTLEGSPAFSYDFDPMHATPSFTTFNPRAAGTAGAIVANDGSNDLANTRVTDTSECHARIDSTSTASGFNNRAYVGVMADATMGV